MAQPVGDESPVGLIDHPILPRCPTGSTECYFVRNPNKVGKQAADRSRVVPGQNKRQST